MNIIDYMQMHYYSLIFRFLKTTRFVFVMKPKINVIGKEENSILSHADNIKKQLDNSIKWLAKDTDTYVKRPGRDFTRNRKLSLENTAKLLISMQGNSLNKEIFDYSKERGLSLTTSAFIQQRSKIKPEFFEDLFHEFSRSHKSSKTFKGYHVYAADGTDLNIPRDPDAATFITSQDKPDGYNQYHINVIYDLCNKEFIDCVLQPRPDFDERGALISMLERNFDSGKNLIITDRGYESYNMLAHFVESKNLDFLCRVKDGRSGLAEVSKLPMEPLDQDISFTVTTTQTNVDKCNGYKHINIGRKKGKIYSKNTTISRWDYASPYTFNLRVIRIKLISGQLETLVTSLDRNLFPLEIMEKLYHMRWGIETSFRELKYAIGLVNLHSRKDEFIRQEIFSNLIAYNFCERITGAVVTLRKKENIHIYQVNYTMAIHICRDFYRSYRSVEYCVMSKIAEYILPIREGRLDKRKFRPKSVISFLYRVAA